MVSTNTEVDTMQESLTKRGTRRRHAPELKQQVVAACREPGASVAALALAHGLNANLVHRWLREAPKSGSAVAPMPSFTPVALTAVGVPVAPDIRLELRRGASSVTVHWPVQAAPQCTAFLREWLK